MNAPDLAPGVRWLAGRTSSERKRAGQWSTPWDLVDEVTRAVCDGLPARPLVVDPATGDGRWLVAVARHRPDARLLGVDTDPEAVAAAREVCARAGVHATIRVADFLAPDPVVAAADLVIGNPPWVRPQNLDRPVRLDLWSRFATATDKADLYACFVERATSIAPRTALVLPDGFLDLASFASLRAHLLAGGVDAVWSVRRDALPSRAVVLVTGPDDARRIGAIGTHEGRLHVGPHGWSVGGAPPDLPGRPLAEFATVHMGIVCGDYDRYVRPRRYRPDDRPTCRGRDVGRWALAPVHEYVWYAPEDMLARKSYVAPKHAGLFDVARKIVLAGTTGTEIRAALDTERRFPLDSCYVVRPRGEVDPDALLGFLLSPQVGAWYAARHPALRVKGVEIARIPLPPTGWDRVAAAARRRDERALEAAVADAYATRPHAAPLRATPTPAPRRSTG